MAKTNPGDPMKRIIEIRSAEGGDDAKLFAKDLATAYTKHLTRVG
jgi:protein subunit release factor A